MSDNEKTIMSRLFDLRDARHKLIESHTKEVNDSFYIPELKKIQNDCEHRRHDFFTCCAICGARIK